MKAIKPLVDAELATIDLSGVSEERFAVLRRVSVLLKYTQQSVSYARYHEAVLGPLTIFGHANRVSEKGMLKHAARVARHASMATGGTISRQSNIIAANEKRAVSINLFDLSPVVGRLETRIL